MKEKELKPKSILKKLEANCIQNQPAWDEALKQIQEYGKQCWIEGTHARHRAFKQSMEDAMNQTQTRIQ